MRHSFSFAVTLHRAFDSAPPKTEASFYTGNRQVFPIEKPNGLYVFLNTVKNPLTVTCKGFMRIDVDIEQDKVRPVILYPDKFFHAPTDWKLLYGNGKSNSLIYVVDSRYEPKLIEHNTDRGFARIRSRKGFTGGCLLFEAEDEKEIALILEKQSPDIFYISKPVRDYAGGTLQRIYCTRTNADGGFYLAVPEDFSFEEADYLYL